MSLISLLLSCISFILIANATKQQLCSRGQDYLVLGFDDITLAPSDFTRSVPWPYRDFLFTRGGAWMDKHVPVTNTTGSPYYGTSPSSSPNVIITTAESLTLEQAATKGNRTFQLLSVSMTSIWIHNMGVFIQMSRNGTVFHTMTVSLPAQVRQSILIDVPTNADKVVIGCTDQAYDRCAHIAYDDFSLCYKHSR